MENPTIVLDIFALSDLDSCQSSEDMQNNLEKINDLIKPFVTGKHVIISEEEYKGLLESELELIALNGAGVDNWEGYSEAMESLNETE